MNGRRGNFPRRSRVLRTQMAKKRTTWICQQCGANSPAFLGRCPRCGEWDTMAETLEARPRQTDRGSIAGLDAGARLVSRDRIGPQGESRIGVGISECTRVLGGGLVAGELVLIGGDPGIGKSTLILQAAGELANQGAQVVYVS